MIIRRSATRRYDVDSVERSTPPMRDNYARVYSNRNIHVLVTSGTGKAHAGCFPVAAHTEAFFSVGDGQHISFIVNEDDISGHVWVTEGAAA